MYPEERVINTRLADGRPVATVPVLDAQQDDIPVDLLAKLVAIFKLLLAAWPVGIAVSVNLGSSPAIAGTFNITGTFDATKKVFISQASGPYTGKGTRSDEAEMDFVSVSAEVINATTARCYWNSGDQFVAGYFSFNYYQL